LAQRLDLPSDSTHNRLASAQRARECLAQRKIVARLLRELGNQTDNGVNTHMGYLNFRPGSRWPVVRM